MSFLLMIFLTLVCLFEGYPRPVGFAAPAWSAGLTWLGVALVGLHALVLSWRTCRGLRGDAVCRTRALRRYERGRFLHQLALFAVFGVSLFVLGWGWTVRRAWGWPGADLLLLAPFLAGLFLSWAVFYDAERAIHRPDETGPFASRLSYLAFLARQKLGLVFIPVVLLVGQKELQRWGPDNSPFYRDAVNLAGCLGLLAVFVTMPWLVRLALGLRPLPEGPLRDRLLAAGRRLGFRCSNLLLWNTRSGMANAMVIGVVPWIRYVVFTDRLLADFSEDEVEAVFGHEVGHVHYRHMLYYLGFLTASMAVLGILADTVRPVVTAWVAERLTPLAAAVLPSGAWDYLQALGSQPDGDLALFPIVGLLLGYVFVVFGFLSRRCERQADVFGCRAVSCHQPDCCGHPPGLELPARGRGLCPTGIRTFVRALEKVADVNGISRDRPGLMQSWQHSTIARRVDFLLTVLADPGVEARFQRRVLLIKWGLFAALVGTLSFLIVAQG